MSSDNDEFRKDFRTGSPQRVFRAINDEITKLGYKVNEKKKKKPSPKEFGGISDVATFDAEMVAEDMQTVRDEGRLILTIVLLIASLILLIVSVPKIIDVVDNDEFKFDTNVIMLIVGVVCIAVAIRLVLDSTRIQGKKLEVYLEGEVYKASAEIGDKAEALDVISDVQLRVKPTLVRSGKFFGSDSDIAESLRNDFALLVNRINDVLPSFEIKQ